jgi:hypothetical protein
VEVRAGEPCWARGGGGGGAASHAGSDDDGYGASVVRHMGR